MGLLFYFMVPTVGTAVKDAVMGASVAGSPFFGKAVTVALTDLTLTEATPFSVSFFNFLLLFILLRHSELVLVL